MNFGHHPLNLLLRLILEIAALLAWGHWGWQSGNGVYRFVMAIGMPLVGAIIWGTFAVPGDPSRSGNAPVPVPGMIRLLIELGLFLMAFLALNDADIKPWAYFFGVAVIIHYTLSIDRLKWLLNQKKR